MTSKDDMASKKSEKSEASPRILARRLARQLTTEEIEVVAGARRAMAGGTCSAGTYCTPDCDD
jgi:hypothetical protein